LTQRGIAARKWLRSRPEKVVAVVSHSGFLRVGVSVRFLFKPICCFLERELRPQELLQELAWFLVLVSWEPGGSEAISPLKPLSIVHCWFAEQYRQYANADFRIFDFGEGDEEIGETLVEWELTEKKGGGLGKSPKGVFVMREDDYPDEADKDMGEAVNENPT
jgi:hypothetical protein